MIKWRDPKSEKPKSGDLIWYVTAHSKRRPASFEILPGYVSYSNDGLNIQVCQNDERGGGSAYAVWPTNEPNDFYYDDIVEAWVPYDEINLPTDTRGAGWVRI
jgi:hypothetical protein